MLPSTSNVATDPVSTEIELDDSFGNLAAWVNSKFSEYERGRVIIEKEWMAAKSAKDGEYSADEKSRIEALQSGRSTVFVKLTSSVCSGAQTLVNIIIAGEDGFPWKMRPTTIAEDPMLDTTALMEAVEMAASRLENPDEQEAFRAKYNFEGMVRTNQEAAQRKCDAMRLQIKDSLDETDINRKLMKAGDPYITYGSMVFQGPLSVVKQPKRWKYDEKSKKWARILKAQSASDPDGDEEYRPEVKSLRIWDVYPDPYARSVDEMEGVIVRHVLSRHQLRELKKNPLFKKDAVDGALAEFAGQGNWNPRPVWEMSMYDAGTTGVDRFEVYEGWFFISGQILKANGLDVADSDLERECLAQVWVCGNHILRATVSNLNPQKLPFYFVPYETVDGRIWGRGVPKQMDDSQKMYNAAQRAILDNMAQSAIPHKGVDVSRLDPRTDPFTSEAGKTWLFSEMEGAAHFPVMWFQPQSNVSQMVQIQNQIRLHIQKETMLPEFALGIPGSGGHNRTAEGLDMQKQAAMAWIRGVIGNIDTWFIGPMIEDLYNWHMEFNPNEEIKGDYEVVAMGAIGSMGAQVMTQRLTAILQQVGPDELKYHIKTGKTIDRVLKEMGIADEGLTYSEDEAEANKEQAAKREAEVKSAPNKMSPTTPPENAALALLQNTDPTSPLYGPAYKQVLDLYQFNNPAFAAGLDVVNEVASKQFSQMMSPQDAAALSQDIGGGQEEAMGPDAQMPLSTGEEPPEDLQSLMARVQANLPQEAPAPPPQAPILNIHMPARPTSGRAFRDANGDLRFQMDGEDNHA